MEVNSPNKRSREDDDSESPKAKKSKNLKFDVIDNLSMEDKEQSHYQL